nr:spore-associated protein A [Micromonospora acroterricola]
MSTVRRAVSAGLVAVAVAAGAPAIGAAPAGASAGYGEQCGPSYRELDDKVLLSSDGRHSFGDVYLMYSAQTQMNCVVVDKSSYVGTATWMNAKIETRSGRVAQDPGNYRYYAGPVYLYAPGECVRYSGVAYSGPNKTGTLTSYSSGFGWCG